ncbi:MAG: 2-hydroxychromene-2-carboxylate isomerase [Rhodoferax sp.]|nr:2-hydroxychromene-2-carboxylate isomerase [Rhodoferax sp.]HQX59559.1 2-hydroxychromene-2-carboxylate isomerase [Burkholderiaceae bacterium]HQZ07195.1 2-hydroxychromene-2-carboxylate isomerase [Burkholderiaceae bacterium]
MQKSVDFLFDFGSPAAYLAWTQLGKLAADTGATVVPQPILLGGVFQATGNRAPITVPLKGSYLFKDLNRYARRYGVALVMNPHFPINTITLMRIDVGMLEAGHAQLQVYRDAVFHAIWVAQRNMNDADTVAQVLAEAGLDAPALLAMAADPQVKESLKVRTQQAVERGAFGAPTFFVGEEMFWGQDRLDFVRAALTSN